MTPLEKKITTNDSKLKSTITSLSRITPDHLASLSRLHIHTTEDLLRHFPTRYADMREVSDTSTLVKGQSVTIYGIMEKVTVRRSFKGHIPLTEARIVDNSGSIRAIWFNQAYIGKMYPNGTRVKVSSVIQEDSKGFLLSNPTIEKVTGDIHEHGATLFSLPENNNDEGSKTNKNSSATNDVSFLTPIYPETKGISSLYIYTLLKKAFLQGVFENIPDPIPESILEKLHLPNLRDAYLYIHFPKNKELTIAARKRFAFEEIFYMQIKQYRERIEAKHSLAYPITISQKELTTFISRFPFTPTEAQTNAITSILEDMKRNDPMGRLLEGDVGSGKTFVAATIAYAVLHSTSTTKGTRLQVAYMAPTEILAKQHFESFIEYFKGTDIAIGLLTGSGCKKFPSKSSDEVTDISRSQLLTWLADGRVSIVIGTHALKEKSVSFANLAFIIIDEQHRFGVKQRKAMARGRLEKKVPHLLSMTATPIPRTLALTIFGDLELTVIDTLPKNRKKIITEIVKSSARNEMYEKVRKELQEGRQVYVICPRIDEQDEEEKQKRILKSVNEEAKRLAEIIFPEFIVDVLHSKMKKKDKELVMEDFLQKKSDILVATSVVEVGVNVPNATVIIIEHADRFGLAQLHQLRGRVGRAHHQSYCYLFTESNGETTYNRLKALVRAKNGFELAEQDMLARGIGTLHDGKQWGLSDLAMEAIKNPKLVEIARKEARSLVDADPALANHNALLSIIEEREKVHME